MHNARRRTFDGAAQVALCLSDDQVAPITARSSRRTHEEGLDNALAYFHLGPRFARTGAHLEAHVLSGEGV